MDEWKPGDPEDWGDHVGVPDIAYMGYINNGDDDERPSYVPYTNKADTLGKEAWDKYMDCKDIEALDLINKALSKLVKKLKKVKSALMVQPWITVT